MCRWGGHTGFKRGFTSVFKGLLSPQHLSLLLSTLTAGGVFLYLKSDVQIIMLTIYLFKVTYKKQLLQSHNNPVKWVSSFCIVLYER